MVRVGGVTDRRFFDGGHVTTGAFLDVRAMRFGRELLVTRSTDRPDFRRPWRGRTMRIMTGTTPELAA